MTNPSRSCRAIDPVFDEQIPAITTWTPAARACVTRASMSTVAMPRPRNAGTTYTLCSTVCRYPWCGRNAL